MALVIAGFVALETFWGGLALAAITGLVWVAYTHPKGYSRLYPFLAGSALLVMVGGAMFYNGYFSGARDQAAAASVVVAVNPPFDLTWFMLSFFAFMALNLVLAFLHPLLGIKPKDDPN